MLNCSVNERNVLEGRLASAHGPRTELFLKSFPSKLQCSQLTVSLSCVQLCLSAAPLILLLFSILNETSSNIICSIKRAGGGGGFSCKWKYSLFDFFPPVQSCFSFRIGSIEPLLSFMAFSTPQHYKCCSFTFLRDTDQRLRAPLEMGQINVEMGRKR